MRDTAATGANQSFGTLTIRRVFTNKTGQPVTRLRFRIVDVTTLDPRPRPRRRVSDMRVLSSARTSVPGSAAS